MYPLCLGVSFAAQEAPKVPTTPVSKSLQTRGPPPSKRHVSFPWKKAVVRNTSWFKHRTFTIFFVLLHYIGQHHRKNKQIDFLIFLLYFHPIALYLIFEKSCLQLFQKSNFIFSLFQTRFLQAIQTVKIKFVQQDLKIDSF